jgi:phosphoglycerate dehydrogenase-like enzyme
MNILILNPIDPKTIAKLSEQHEVICAFNSEFETIKKLIQDRELMIFRSGVSVNAELMECAPDLKWLIRAGSGIDNIDMKYVKERGINLQRIPGPGARAVAEMSFALMLAISRRLFEADRSMRQGEWAKYKIVGKLLKEKTLGIIGVGNIGSQVAQLGVSWGMEVIGCVEFPSPTRVVKMKAKKIHLTNFDTVISNADYLSIHVPLQTSTRYIINAEALNRMKKGSILINLSRGGVVDENALFRALISESTVSAAALDVHEYEGNGRRSPLADLANVILTPHIGATVFETQQQIGMRIQELVETFMSE